MITAASTIKPEEMAVVDLPMVSSLSLIDLIYELACFFVGFIFDSDAVYS